MYRIIQYIDRALSKCAKLLFCTQMRALVQTYALLSIQIEQYSILNNRSKVKYFPKKRKHFIYYECCYAIKKNVKSLLTNALV